MSDFQASPIARVERLSPRSLFGTGILVSPICIGTMTFGNPVQARDAEQLVSCALDLGVNFFDTADSYEGYDRVIGSKGGLAESILGAAVRRVRERVIITTKVGNDVGGRGLGRG